MPTPRELKRIARLEKIKARKEAKAGTAVTVHSVENDGLSEAVEVVSAILSGVPVKIEQTAPAAIILSPPKPAEDGPGVEGIVIRKARIYAKPVNVRLRLIEFEDGSHGKMWVRADAAPMLNWLVHVRPSGLVRGDWELHGRYNWKGTRMQ